MWDDPSTRVVTHAYFFLTCCLGFIASISPRILVAIDFPIALVWLILGVNAPQTTSTEKAIAEIFWISEIDLVLISLIRSVLLFRLYQTRFHTRPWAYDFCTLITGISIVHLLLRCLTFRYRPRHLVLGIFMLFFVITEHASYLLTRRKKIL